MVTESSRTVKFVLAAEIRLSQNSREKEKLKIGLLANVFAEFVSLQAVVVLEEGSTCMTISQQ